MTDLFDGVDAHRLIDSFATAAGAAASVQVHVPLFTAHCNAYTEEQPVWKISSATFESVLALYQRDQDAFDRGVGAG